MDRKDLASHEEASDWQLFLCDSLTTVFGALCLPWKSELRTRFDVTPE